MAETSSAGGGSFRRETERVVDEIAQELRSSDDGAARFSSLSPARRQEVCCGTSPATRCKRRSRQRTAARG
ncbi:hypothetical protein [Streptomyces monashensis]|uniref:hypothetical protein n=1 Tax=Streptomyces monashensis TaxID=1678012 RepID=UPI001160C28E|nr:hypothetical protein [Streptomyces monashensis]